MDPKVVGRNIYFICKLVNHHYASKYQYYYFSKVDGTTGKCNPASAHFMYSTAAMIREFNHETLSSVEEASIKKVIERKWAKQRCLLKFPPLKEIARGKSSLNSLFLVGINFFL